MPLLIGIGVAMLTTAIANVSAGIPFWHGMGKAATVGAISAVISFGIGEVVTGITGFWAKAGLQAGLHGMKSGMMSAIEGGDFLSGLSHQLFIFHRCSMNLRFCSWGNKFYS